ncbi:MAG: sodium:solute symporter family transporter, partial [Planctomycetota bacterium]
PNPEVGSTASEFDQIMMTVLRNQLPAMLGYAGMILVTLFSVAVMAASMSTADSNLHALSALLTRDIYDRFIRPGASQVERAWVGRIVIAVASLIALLLVLIGERSTDFNIVKEIGTLMNWAVAFSSQLIPVAIDMLYIRRGTRLGAIAGMVAGLTAVIAFTPLGAGATGPLDLADTLKLISQYMHAGMAGFLVNAAVFTLVSAVTPRLDPQRIDRFKQIMAGHKPPGDA